MMTQADIVTPAETRSWEEWAAKAPELLRHNAPVAKQVSSMATTGSLLSAGLGAALGIASFTNYVRGKWKIATGAGSGALLYTAAALYPVNNIAGQSAEVLLRAAEKIEQSPQMKKRLAEYLSSHVTAQDIQQYGIESAVAGAAMEMILGPQSMQKEQENAAFSR